MSKYLPLFLIALLSVCTMSAQFDKPVKTAPVPVQTVPVQPSAPVKVNPAILTQLALRDVDFQNWGFEKGLAGWTAEGTAFATQPTVGYNIATQRVLYSMEYNNGGLGGDYWKNMGINPGYTGNYWIGTYENNPRGNQFMNVQGDAPTGVLTSQEFQLTTNYCYFNIGGGADPARLFVELQLKQPDGSWRSQLTKSSFRSNEMMYRERMDIAPFKNQTARIRIVDNSTGGWGHINVDNFRFVNELLPAIQLTDQQTRQPYEVDVDYPVWGVADTHAHPMHQDGFGGRLIAGKPNSPMSETYSTDVCRQTHGVFGALPIMKLFVWGGDEHKMSGWPDLTGFPNFTSKTHQQQHVEFLKRAWQGGLKLFCALAVNNMFVPSLALGPGNDGRPWDDESAILRQISLIQEMVSQNNQWMEIALTPRDARRIILQGKLAVVIGIEVDNLGNFKTAEYNWNDQVGPANRPLVALNDINADGLLDAKLTDYYIKGVRQITPMHYISGLFGGAAVFRGEIAGIQMAFNNNIKVKNGADKRIPFSLMKDYTTLLMASNPLLTYEGYKQRILNQGGDLEISTMNAQRMTSIGTRLINKMMTKGFIIDSEHMGYDTKEDLFSVAGARNYPVISSHTDPAGISNNWLGQPAAFRTGDAAPDLQFNQSNFGTTNIRNLANEFQLADEHYTRISQSGGTVGVFMLPYLKKPYTGHLGSIPNDCAGSSKTWAQMYLYSVEKMGYRGVALCSDRGMTDFIGPRFGPNSAYTLKDEKLTAYSIDERRRQRLSQTNGVRYDSPLRSYNGALYENLQMIGILPPLILTYVEEDAWKAMAANEAGLNRNQIAGGRELTKENRVRNFLEGLQIGAIDDPMIKTADYFEKAAMFCVRNNRNLNTLPGYNTWFENDRNFIIGVYNTISQVYRSWNARNGNNQPLRRLRTGNREWDYNTDGMAHYGMMPDFFQDLKNIGLRGDQLSFLFQSAEDYIRMWEKTVKASGVR